jgi:predicted amidohydrolase/glycerophosphoryl diester phosphodiesterase
MKAHVLVLAIGALTIGLLRGNIAHAEEIPTGHVRVAGIVLKWLRTDKEANCRRAETLIEQAARGGAQLVCTTECFLDGYAIKDKSIPLDEYRALGEPIPNGPFYQRLAALADRLNIHLIAGLLEADGEHRYNTAIFLGPDGKLLGKYRKHSLEHELVRNTPGTETPVFQTPFGTLGIMICADRRDPDLVRRLKAGGANLLICPSGGMFGPKSNDPIVQARSKENQIPILFVHPAEFLVTDAAGEISARTILGDRLEIEKNQVGGEADKNEVFFFDLPLAAVLQARPVKPLPRAHAHNDYEHPRPLLDALDHGFCSVEADIWLTPDGLLVGHDRKDLKPERTLQKLYLDPLRERIKANSGRVYRNGPPFFLLIDVKTAADETYAALDKVLADYADILTTTADRKTEQKAVTAILSGNRAIDTVARQHVCYVGIDGRPENLDSNEPTHLVPWISANWNLLFTWKGDGPMPAAEKEKLAELVGKAHGQGRQVRFWATPEKEAVWTELTAAGVDYINTDKLAELRAFLVKQQTPRE